MSVQNYLSEDHEVLSLEPSCSGYVDGFGKWNNGFRCPTESAGKPVHCCGADIYRYCCTLQVHRPAAAAERDAQHELTVLVGVGVGCLISVISIVWLICWFCKSCPCYRHRRVYKADRLYSVPTGSLANMYSCTSNSLGGHGGHQPGQDTDGVLTSLDAVAVHHPERFNRRSGMLANIPRSFSPYRPDPDFHMTSENNICSPIDPEERRQFLEPLPGSPPPPYISSSSNCSSSSPGDHKSDLILQEMEPLHPLRGLSRPPRPFLAADSISNISSSYFIPGLADQEPEDYNVFQGSRL